jgi:hypothetical protein
MARWQAVGCYIAMARWELMVSYVNMARFLGLVC